MRGGFAMSRMERDIIAAPVHDRRRAEREVEAMMRGVFRETPLTQRRSRRGWWVLGCALAVLVVIYGANWMANPLRFGSGAVAAAGQGLADGRPYRVASLEMDFRALRLAHIAALTRTPDLLVLGAGPWREVHQDLRWGGQILNAFHPNADIVDYRAVIAALRRTNRMPDHVVISVGSHLLRTPGQSLADRASQFSPIALATRLASRPGGGEGATMDVLAPGGWVLLPDGSALPGSPRGAPKQSELGVLSAAASRALGGFEIASESVAMFETLVAGLVQDGRSVRLVHPPVHPRFWEAVQGTAYHRALSRVEAIAAETAERHGLTVLGGFDPAGPGCDAGLFRDAFHASPGCLSRVIGPLLGLPAT